MRIVKDFAYFLYIGYLSRYLSLLVSKTLCDSYIGLLTTNLRATGIVALLNRAYFFTGLGEGFAITG